MLGTLHHFTANDEVSPGDMPELERLMLHQLAEQDAIVRKAYEAFDYKTVVATLSAFMNTELSAFYFDIRKDTLYCDPISSVARKAALTTIDILCDAILKWLAPILSFTCDEAFSMYWPGDCPSVHLLTFPFNLGEFRDDALAAKWETIRDVRRVVTGALELERAAKTIGSSLEASPIIYVSDRAVLATLFDIDLAEVCITSNYEVREGDAPDGAFRLDNVPGVAVVVEKAQGIKCARSWKILPTVGEDPEYPDVSPRDAQALREWHELHEPAAAPKSSQAPVAPLEYAPPIVPQSPALVEEPPVSQSETAQTEEAPSAPIDPIPTPKKRPRKTAPRNEQPATAADVTEEAAVTPKRARTAKPGKASVKQPAKKAAKKKTRSKPTQPTKAAKKARPANKTAKAARPAKKKAAKRARSKPPKAAARSKTRTAKKAKKRKTARS
jgi:isoleucyl-tRNA synthetase